MSQIGICCFIVVALMGSPSTFAADMLVDDVPIPADVQVSIPRNASETLSRFSGAWVGSWGGQLHHVLIVEDITADDKARVVYAVGDNAAVGVKSQWHRHKATISGDTLTIAGTRRDLHADPLGQPQGNISPQWHCCPGDPIQDRICRIDASKSDDRMDHAERVPRHNASGRRQADPS